MSVTTITFSRAGSSIKVNTPQFGYTSEIHLALKIGARLGTGKHNPFDNGAEHDIRYFIGRFILNTTQQNNLQTFFRTETQGRGHTVQMLVPKGIFPFGPDLGGGPRRFQVRLIPSKSKWGFSGRRPWLQYHNELVFVMVSAPSYSLPERIGQGNRLQIGPVTGFRFPPSWYEASTTYRVSTLVTYGGYPHTIDATNQADYWETGFRVTGNETMAAHGISYLAGTARGSAFHIRCEANAYPFGRDHGEGEPNSGAGDFTVRLLEPVISVTHHGINQFEFGLKLGLEKWYPRDSSSSCSTSSYSRESDSSSSGSSLSISRSSSSISDTWGSSSFSTSGSHSSTSSVSSSRSESSNSSSSKVMP
jgi:hypothetical protein